MAKKKSNKPASATQVPRWAKESLSRLSAAHDEGTKHVIGAAVLVLESMSIPDRQAMIGQAKIRYAQDVVANGAESVEAQPQEPAPVG